MMNTREFEYVCIQKKCGGRNGERNEQKKIQMKIIHLENTASEEEREREKERERETYTK